MDETYKNERRRILSTLADWNVGITPNGQLASDPCFVHHSVPDIIFEDNRESAIQSTYISTTSKWTSNMIYSSVSNPDDIETFKSLSVCKAIFQNYEPDMMEANMETIHLTKQNVKAYVIVDNIARLTNKFEDELSKAEEHWPHSPQKSWDKLCLIWKKYGFLWPMRVHIGFKIHEKFENKDKSSNHSVKNYLQQKSQGVLLHSPKYYSVIWRTMLKPVHEYFPTQYRQKKHFINNIIHQYSTLVFSDSLIRLKSLKSGEYLGRKQHEYGPKWESISVLAVPSNNASVNKSNVLWKFDDAMTTTDQSASPVSVGSVKYLHSGQDEYIILGKSQQYLTAFHENNTFQPRATATLIKYKQPKDRITQLGKSEYFKCSIGLSDLALNSNHDDTFCLDKSIHNHRCLLHEDEITLNQQGLYIRAASNSSFNDNPPISTSNTPFGKERSSIESKSSHSIRSYGDQYSFSPVMMSDSNSAQLTNASDYSQSSFSLSQTKKPRDNVRNLNVSPAQSNTLIYFEKPLESNRLPTEYCWRIEMASKSLANNRDEVLAKEIDRISITEKTAKSPICIANMVKTYSPKLNMDITRLNSPITLISEHSDLPGSNTKDDTLIATLAAKLNEPGPEEPTLEQVKSKWLDVNPQLYKLHEQILTNEDVEENQSKASSEYATPVQSSIKSATSPKSSLLLKASEKKLGKQPLQAPKLVFASNYQDNDSESWSSSEPSSPIDKNDEPDLLKLQSFTSALTEAESFKRGIQQNYEKENNNEDSNAAHDIILKSMFAPSVRSNTTSQIQYYDQDQDSSHIRAYTMTPGSKYSRQFTPSSAFNLTPEEQAIRKMNREKEFMLLLENESKQQFWVSAIKRASLGSFFKGLSHSNKQIPKSSFSNLNGDSSLGDIRLNHQNNNSNRMIQKKKGFYKKNGNLRRLGTQM